MMKDAAAWRLAEIAAMIRSDANRSIFVKGAAGSFVAKFFGAGLVFLSQAALARLLGAAQYGVYAYALSWMTVLAIFAKMGFETSLLRFLPEYKVKGQWPLFRGVIRFSFSLVGVVSLFFIVLGQMLLTLLSHRLDAELLLSFRIMLFVLPFFAWTAIRQSCLRGLKHVVLAELPEGVLRPLLLIAVAWLLAGRLAHFDAAWAWVSHLVAVFFAFVFGTVLLVKALPGEHRRARSQWKSRVWIKVSSPMLLMNSMNIILSQSAIVVLGIFKPAEQVAVFSASARIVILATFALLAVNSIAAPMISELFYAGKKRELQSLLRLAALGIAVVTFIAALFILLGGRLILGLFGKEFVDGYAVLLILLMGFMMKSFVGPASYLLNLTGHQNITAKAMAAAVVFAVLLSFVLIPKWGALGAALSSSLTMIVWNGTLLALNLKIVGIDPSLRSVFRKNRHLQATQP